MSMKHFRKTALALAVLLLCLAPSAMGEARTLRLPSGLRVIGEEAFFGGTAIGRVIVPEGVEEIRARAFANSGVFEIRLPRSVSYIAPDAFEGVARLTVEAEPGSYACDWAAENGLLPPSLPESAHPCEEAGTKDWTYVHPWAAEALRVVFSPWTALEDFDGEALTVIDSTGAETVYVEKQLAGAELVLPGDRFALRLTTAGSYVAYGFKVVSVEGMNAAEYAAYLAYSEASPFRAMPLPDGTLEITGYDGEDAEIEVPAEIGGVEVTAIGACAFANRAALRGVVLPEGIARIGSYAFSDCEYLKRVDLPEGLVRIEERAFSDCERLTRIELPGSVTFLGEGALSRCAMSTVTVPEGVTELSEGLFIGCDYLRRVILPDGLARIGEGAFMDCMGLSRLAIPESVTEIGRSAFAWCTSLQSVNIPSGVTRIEERTFAAARIDDIALPEGVVRIGGGAFAGCNSLKTVSLPDSLESIGDGAFSDCTQLTAVDLPGGVTEIGDRAFSSSGLAGIRIPEGVRRIGESAFDGCRSLEAVELPDSVTEIGQRAFYDCDTLKRVRMSEGVVRIGEDAFFNCKDLTAVRIPASAAEIAPSAFAWCSLTVYGEPGSRAEAFAAEQGFPFEAGALPEE